VTQTTASCGGNITSDGGASIITRGVCWSTNQTPTIADSKTTDGIGAGNFTSNITGLTPNTTYYVRAYATNNTGTGYGSILSFVTQNGSGGTVTDIDGNVYQTVTIGTQIWMAENLKTTKYRDGTSIISAPNISTWSTITIGAYSNYDNDPSNSSTYGRLYNSYAVTDTHNICPSGWHVPSDAEWTTLVTYLGGNSVAGGKLKETGTAHWTSPNTGATNESGFTALPGGYRRFSGAYFDLSHLGFWWTSTSNSTIEETRYRRMNWDGSEIDGGQMEWKNGCSVRCLKD
ncbi:fibrobacter succinogenes major paralogous domain-containing protein, partial [candidate division KSB1 bacterium]